MARERISISKEWLQSLGITNVTKDGKVFKGEFELKSYPVTCKHKYGNDKKYLIIQMYSNDLYKKQLREGKIATGLRPVLLSRIVYAWFNDICPSEYDVDHIDNNPFNNSIDNLQLLTRKENIAKRGAARNQYNYYLSNEELDYFNEQKRSYESMINEAKKWIEEEKAEIEKIQKDLDYYTEICKKISDYKLYKELKEDYKNRMSEHKEALKRHRDSWHYWCKAYKDFKTAYLKDKRKENE